MMIRFTKATGADRAKAAIPLNRIAIVETRGSRTRITTVDDEYVYATEPLSYFVAQSRDAAGRTTDRAHTKS